MSSRRARTVRCARVQQLIEAYVDGALDPVLTRGIDAHLQQCARCTAEVIFARQMTRALVDAQAIKAPRGFADRVMEAVYREALAGGAREAPEGVPAPRAPARIARMYRRLGLSFMLTAVVLAASLLVPRLAYPTLLTAGGSRPVLGGSSATVQGALEGAGRAVQGILGEHQIGGNER